MFHVEELLLDESTESISPIEDEIAQIRVPREVLAGQGRGQPIRMASFLFRNMSGLLPQRLENNGTVNDRYIFICVAKLQPITSVVEATYAIFLVIN